MSANDQVLPKSKENQFSTLVVGPGRVLEE